MSAHGANLVCVHVLVLTWFLRECKRGAKYCSCQHWEFGQNIFRAIVGNLFILQIVVLDKDEVCPHAQF